MRYRLVADPSGFKAGTDAAKKEIAGLANEMTGKLGAAGSVLSKLGPAGVAAAAGIGAITAAAVAAAQQVSKLAQYADRLSALKDQTGLAAGALQKLELAAKLGNSSLEGVASAVNKMQKNLVEGSKAFDMLGLNVKALKEQSPEDQLKAVAVAIEGLSTPAEKAAARMAVFGKSGNELAGTLKALAEGAADLGGELSDETVAAAAELQDELDRLGTAWDRMLMQMAAVIAENPDLIGGLRKIVDVLADLATWIDRNSEKLGRWLNLMARVSGLSGLGAVADLAGRAAGEHRFSGWGAASRVATPGPAGGRTFDPGTWERAEKHAKGVAAAAEKARREAEAAARVIAEQVFNAGVGGGGFAGAFGLAGGAFRRAGLFGVQGGPVAAPAPAVMGSLWANMAHELTLGVRRFGTETARAATALQRLESASAKVVRAFDIAFAAIGAIQGITGQQQGGLAGLMGGAQAGMGFGSMFGPIGGALGGIVGGIGGMLFGGANEANRQRKEAHAQALADIQQMEGALKRINEIKLEKLNAGVGGLAALLKHAGEAGDMTQERMNRLGLFGAAIFEELKRQGMGTAEAFRAMGPALDAALAAAERNGLQIQGTLGMLADFQQKVLANEGLVGAAEGLSAVFDALRSTGNLTAETFAALQTEVGTVFDELIGKGFTTDQALALLAPTLLQARNAAREMGLSVDETTQALIEQAEQRGMFEGLTDPMAEMVELQKMMLVLWAAIAHMQKVELPASLQEYLRTLEQANNLIPGAGGGQVTGPGGGGPPQHFQEPEFQHGSGGFRDFGAVTPALLHGPEAVMTPGDLGDIAEMLAARIGGGGEQPFVINMDGVAIARGVAKRQETGYGRIKRRLRSGP